MGTNPCGEKQVEINNIKELKDNLEHFYDYIMESQVQQILPGLINKEDINELYQNESSMCIIRFETDNNGNISNNGLGNGFFCKFDYEGIPFKKALFTNNHILNDLNIRDGQKLYFEGSSIEIVINQKRKVFTSEKLDYTCVEILDEDNINNFFEIDETILRNKKSLEGEEIFTFQYSDKKLSFSAGKILIIKGNIIIHSAYTTFGSSGSPLIRKNRNNKKYIIGIHFGSIKEKYYGKLATSFDEILKDIQLKIQNIVSDNLIISNILIKEDNFRAKIINSYENAKNEDKLLDNNFINNDKQIRDCDIYINKEKIDFNYYYTFPKKGNYEIIYIFHQKLNSTNFMFYKCKCLNKIDLSRFNSGNVTNMGSMFSRCEGLTDLNLSNLNTINVGNMSALFNECFLLENIDLSFFDTHKVKDMSEMFNRCEKLKSLDSIARFNTEKVTNMLFMFWGCESLQKLNLSRFNTRNVNNMGGMFCKCKSLEELTLSPNFITENVENMKEMFMECYSIVNLDLSSFTAKRVTQMLGMFADCRKLKYLNLKNFNCKNVKDVNHLFSKCHNLKQVITDDARILNLFN